MVLDAMEAIAKAPRASGPLRVLVPVTIKDPPTEELPVIEAVIAVKLVALVVESVALEVAVREPKVALDPVSVPIVPETAFMTEATRFDMKELVEVVLLSWCRYWLLRLYDILMELRSLIIKFIESRGSTFT